MNYNFADRVSNLQASAIREILKFTQDPSVISFAAGNPAPEAFPVDAIAEITADILKKQPIAALQYSISEGYPELRQALSHDLKSRHSIGNDFDSIIITTGAQQGIEIAAKVMCNQGDTVICEKPSFVGSLNSIRSFGCKLTGIELEEDGISLSRLEAELEQNKSVKLLYLIPNFQNPTGGCMSLEKRRKCYELCLKHNVMILEDNPYGELRFAGEHIPAIKSFDTEGIVIYCGSFSKVLSPGLRVGFVCAPEAVIQKFVVCKQASDVHTTILSQMICYEFMTKYNFLEHINGLKQIYKKKCELMLSCLDNKLNPKISYTRPQGGLFIWGTLPDGVDMMDFCRRAVLHKVAIVPGSAFMPNESDHTQSFRLNFSTPTDEQIKQGCELLGELSHQIL